MASGPLLGSDYLRSVPQIPQGIEPLSPSLCSNISRFKTLLANYRKLDDSVILRLNRAHALNARDPRRPYSEVAEDECARFWAELMQVWQGREQAIKYCVAVSDERCRGKEKEILGSEGIKSDVRLDQNRSARDELYGEEVKRQQIAREIGVEQIVRKRTLEAFLTRCRTYQSVNVTIALQEAAEKPRPVITPTRAQ